MTYSKKFFGSIGFFIGSYPAILLIISLLIFGISIFGPIFRFDIRTNIKNGFTPNNSPSTKEIRAYVEFFGDGKNAEPWYMAIFVTAQNGSLLSEGESDELTSFNHYINKEMQIEYDNSSVTYDPDLCHPFCGLNSALWKILQYQSFFNLRYPVTTIGPFKVNIGKFFFERTVDEKGVVTSVKTIAIYFSTFITSERKAKQLEIFEENVLREAKSRNSMNGKIKIIVHGARTVGLEVQHGAILSMPFYLIGAALLIIFVLLCFVFVQLYYGDFNSSRILLALAAIISPVLASLTAINFLLLFGYHINILMLISPFLTLAIGIGVDDAFLITNTWMAGRKTSTLLSCTTAERLQRVFEIVGVGIFITSITNIIGFSLGSITPGTEIRLFCTSVALSMFFDLLFQLLFYAPLHTLLTKEEMIRGKYFSTQERQSTFKTVISRRIKQFVEIYSKFVSSLWAEFIIVAVLIAYFYISIRGITKLKPNLDGKLLIPRNSQSVEGVRILSEIVWNDFLSMNFIIQNPPNFSDPKQYQRFTEMVKKLESLKQSVGAEGTMLWIKDYRRYLANPSASILDLFFGFSEHVPVLIDDNEPLDMSHFTSFINTEPYDAWMSGVHYKTDSKNRTSITSMLLIVGYKGITSLYEKAKLIPACRQIASEYPEYNMHPFDTDAQLVDVILGVPKTTMNTIICTIVAIGLVFFVLSCNIPLTLVAVLSVASISTGMLGFMSYWGCYYDPLTMIAIIMSAGLGVDYTVHVTIHYFATKITAAGKAERIANTFKTCAFPMLQAGISTFLVMFPVLFAPVGAYVVIAKAVVLVVILGLLHGLLILPILLTFLPNSLTTGASIKCC